MTDKPLEDKWLIINGEVKRYRKNKKGELRGQDGLKTLFYSTDLLHFCSAKCMSLKLFNIRILKQRELRV